MNTKMWAEHISCFRKKVEFLSQKKRYKHLLRSIFASNDLSEFNSYAFEILFAYDFEVNQQKLAYEINQLPDENSSVDYAYTFDKYKIYFELRLVQQRQWITDSVDSQLTSNQQYEIQLNGSHEAKEAERLQNLILSKCQKPDGTPIKFFKIDAETINFIVVNISDLHLGMIDEFDCLLTMNGDSSVSFIHRRGVFGMWQDLPETPSKIEKQLYKKFKHFREMIHGVLFVRHKKNEGCLKKILIDKELEYLSILNLSILPQETTDLLITKLSSFLDSWVKGNSKKDR